MAGPYPAKNSKVAIGGNKINGQGTFNMNSATQDEVEDTQFGDSYRTYSNTLKNRGDFSFEGWLDAEDTNGQNALRTAHENGTGLTDLRFYVNANSYYHPNKTGDPADSFAKITAFSIGSEVNGLVRCSFSGNVQGKWTLV